MRQLVVICILFSQIFSISSNKECSKTVCNPRSGDLLIGRESLLAASSTCGLKNSEKFCALTLSDKTKCGFCYSKDRYNSFNSPNSHRIENVVSRLPQDPLRWWQSESGIHNVSIEIAFETEFQFIFTQLRFKTYRPAAMFIERSKDYGYSWQRSAYFSDSCSTDFRDVPEKNRNTISDVSCTSEFSEISPAEGGTVRFVASPSDLHTNDKDWLEKRNELTAITNLRVRFTRLNLLGDTLKDDNKVYEKKYYYALSEWIIRGRCSCYGHASTCQPKEGQAKQIEMVYGVCVCQHNTIGPHCEKCKDFFNDRPWLPAEINSTNECKKCECNSHSKICHFDPVAFVLSGKKSGGICDSCLDNTEGKNCDRCRSGYYRNSGVAISSMDTCLKCKCDPYGTRFPSLCIQEMEPGQILLPGACVCKENVDGYNCDRCKIGYWNFDKNDDKGCTECKCLMIGTEGNQGCNPLSGNCNCKRFVEGLQCNSCKEGYYNMSSSDESGCSACGCNGRGTLDNGKCDKSSGQCKCKQGYIGRTCNEIKSGWYIDSPRHPLQHNKVVQIELPPVSKSGFYNFIITMDTQQMVILDTYHVILTIDHKTRSTCPQYQDSISITKDSKKIVVPNKCLLKDLPIVISVFVISGETSRPPSIIDIVVVPMISPNSTATRSALGECLKYPPNQMPPHCNFLNAEQSSRAISKGDPKSCNCNVTGSVNNICNIIGGQCHCLPNVVGRQCDQCAVNSYGFDAMGCKSCDCEPAGSLNLQCAADTGKCLCRKGVEGRLCKYCKDGFWKFPYCSPCKCHGMAVKCDKKNGRCFNCKDNSFGFNCQQCHHGYYGDPSKNLPCLKCNCPGLSYNLDHSKKCSLIFNTSNYMCVCKSGYKGSFCDECDENHFGNPREKNGACRPCHCSFNINSQVPGSCDVRTGECKKCLYNTAGFNCEKCAVGYFGDGVARTCKKCVCNQLGTNSKAPEICHHETGKCPCLPNVLGLQCDKCQTSFYNISSGRGCLPCDCDSSNGALSELCNAITGQCQCRQSRSGRQCDKCEDGYWGDPRRSQGCKVCHCDASGSLFNQCDRNNGVCRCKPGISGRFCDTCARGTDGKMPNCTLCGDCWVQWDQIIRQLTYSIEELQNGTTTNLTEVGIPKVLFVIINNTNLYVNSLKSIMKTPDDIDSQVHQLQMNFNLFKSKIDDLNVVDFNLSDYDSTKITKAIAEMNEIVASNKIQDFKGAYMVILSSLKSLIDATNATNTAMTIVEKMKSLTQNREMQLDNIDEKKLEAISKKLANLETTLNENLKKFNILTCNSGSNLSSDLCSDKCGGVGCVPNTCFRNRALDEECYRNKTPTFFNAYVRKLGDKKNQEDNFREIGRNLNKSMNGKLADTESELDATRQLIGMSNSTINSRYEKAVQLLENIRYIINSSVSEEAFKKLLEAINNFKLSSHEEEIKKNEIDIKSRIQQLNEKVNDVLIKSKENRKECDQLKDTANIKKEKATNLLKSIKDIEENLKLILKTQSETKAVIDGIGYDEIRIRRELKEIQQNQNETDNNQNNINKTISSLTLLYKDIEEWSKEIIGDLKSLEKEQAEITRDLGDKKLRVGRIEQRIYSLKGGEIEANKKKERNHSYILKEINELKKRIKTNQEKLDKFKESVAKKQSETVALVHKVEEKLVRLSSLEYEIYKKSEYQALCLP